MSEEIVKSNKFDSILKSIDNGRSGNNKGIPISFNRLRQFLPNIQQSTYYLCGAGTKIGKTSFVDDVFLYGSLDYILSNPDCNIELDIDYFSFEIDSKTKLVKGVARRLWHDYNIIADVNTILSKGEHYCSDELYNIVKGYRNYFEQIEDYLTVHDMTDNATGINKYLIDKAKKRGTIEFKNINKDPEGEPIMRFDKYTPNKDNVYWLIIIDHIALLREERGFNTKQNIDKMSQYLVSMRNNFGATPVVIQQLTFDTDNDERFKSNRLTPTLKDFGDSKYTTRDANVIMTLYSPYRHGITQFEGYDITKLGNKFRNLEILENRDGEPNVNIGLNFIDKVGTFRELPRPKEMNPESYKYAFDMENRKSSYYKNESGVWIER